MTDGFSLYVHIPFCETACPYCNFNFRLRRNFDDAFVEAYLSGLLTEWNSRRGLQSGPLRSLYFGGGTPSLLSPLQVGRLIDGIGDSCAVATPIEVTLEANPEQFSRDLGLLHEFRAAGINRLSIGLQTFDPGGLKLLGRNHDPRTVANLFKAIRAAGFQNVSADLMFAYPGENLFTLSMDLQDLLFLGPDHVSIYNLTIEEKTPFHAARGRGELHLPSEDTQVAMIEMIGETLSSAGLERYEISNFARPGFESRHNEGYWHFRPYQGLGAGAHSFWTVGKESLRSMNISEPRDYLRRVESNASPEAWRESLTGRKAMGEYVLTRLRRVQGFSTDDFLKHFDVEVADVFTQEIRLWAERGLLTWRDVGAARFLALTPKGLLLADSVFESFV